jgi:hypothetical protein
MKAKALGLVAGVALAGLSFIGTSYAGGAGCKYSCAKTVKHGYKVCYSKMHRYVKKFRWYKRYAGYGQYRWVKVYYGGYYRPYYWACHIKRGNAPCHRTLYGWYPSYYQAKSALNRCRNFYAYGF